MAAAAPLRLRPRPLQRCLRSRAAPLGGLLTSGVVLAALGLLPSRGLAKRLPDGSGDQNTLLNEWAVVSSRNIGKMSCCCKRTTLLLLKPCQYREVEVDGKRKCCKMRRGGCPLMSLYVKEDPDACYGSKEDLFGYFRLHPKYELVGLHGHRALAASSDIQPLGEGASARVYLAQDMKTKRLVALKVPSNQQDRAKLKNECANVRAVHRRIAAGDASAFGGSFHLMACIGDDFDFIHPFVVLEYAGDSPYKTLSRSGTRHLLGLMKQVFLGLASLHRSRPSQLHHDLKWDNVAVDDQGCLKIIDLETVVKSTEDNSFADTFTTQGIAPPEATSKNFQCGTVLQDEFRTCTLGYTFDAYSAGVMMASTLCGAPEFFLATQGAGAPYSEAVWMTIEEFASKSIAEQVEMLGNASEDIQQLDNSFSWLYSPWHTAFRTKFHFCVEQLRLKTEARPAGGLQVVDDLRHPKPELRPDPARVLEDDLFRNVPTGCAADISFAATFASAGLAGGPAG
mmetsp:Transcript_97222/g.245291  ORF Transcript_97222/g.245291 Transcript_97222/m.245291 type:complete len:510 (-) Transcript_97222:43-1572(-)